MRLTRLRRTLSLAGLALVGAATARFVRASQRRNAAFSDLADREVGEGGVRPAGSEAMRDPPQRWSERDEASDESFPASDSSAKY